MKATLKKIELIDDEDLFVAMLYFHDTVREDQQHKIGMDIWINDVILPTTN